MRSPDVWFLSHERPKEVARESFYEGAPDLAVEVVFPGEEAEGVLAKVLDYPGEGPEAPSGRALHPGRGGGPKDGGGR